MDAYNIYHMIKALWAQYVDKHSGSIIKSSDSIKVCVWTSEGYRQVTSVHYNNELKCIELELDKE